MVGHVACQIRVTLTSLVSIPIPFLFFCSPDANHPFFFSTLILHFHPSSLGNLPLHPHYHYSNITTHISLQLPRLPSQPQPLHRNRPRLRPNLHLLARQAPHNQRLHHLHSRRQLLLLQHRHNNLNPVPQLRRPPLLSPQNRPRVLSSPSNILHGRSTNPLPPLINLRHNQQCLSHRSPQSLTSSALRRTGESRIGVRCCERRIRILYIPTIFAIAADFAANTRITNIRYPAKSPN